VVCHAFSHRLILSSPIPDRTFYMLSGSNLLPFSLPDLRESIRYYARGLYRELTAKNVFLWAQAIAFKLLVTIVPIVILATGMIGQVLRREDAFGPVSEFIQQLLPPPQSESVLELITQIQSASGAILGIGGLGLFLSAMSLFVTLRIAVSNAFEQNWHEERSLVSGYVFDVRMVLQVGLLFLLTVGLSIVLPPFLDRILGRLHGTVPWLQSTLRNALHVTSLLLPLLVTMAMFFHLYYLVPLPHPRKQSAFAGAALAALLWEGTKQGFTYYATYVGQFEQYGVTAFGNTIGLMIAFLFWVYFSSIVLMLGAVLASLHEHRHVTAGHLPGDEPPPEALPIAREPPDPASSPSETEPEAGSATSSTGSVHSEPESGPEGTD